MRLIASRPHDIVFAGARNPSKATALQKLAAENPNVHIVKLDSTSVADVQAAAQTVEKVSGGLDIVIANAGTGENWDKLIDVDPQSLVDHFKVNTVGPLILFQGLYPVLLKRQTRKFITVSSSVAGITDMLKPTSTAYGTSKAALNFITKRIHMEHSADGFIAFPIHPGAVKTDMGLAAASAFGIKDLPLSPGDSAKGVLAVVEAATTAESDRFWNYDGTENRW